MTRPLSVGSASIEKAWLNLDKHGHFGSLKTFHSYLKALDQQIGRILAFLQKQIIHHNADFLPRDIFPDRTGRLERLSLLYIFLDELKNALHKKGLCRNFLESENASFLSAMLFREENLIFLRNTS